jgi:ABC-type cobalt transport system substrate-binding protein
VKKPLLYALVVLAMVAVGYFTLSHFSQAKWSGVDETVVEKYARAAGHPPHRPLIDTDQGDLLLFCFLLAGVAGGFVIGYYIRDVFPPENAGLQDEAAPSCVTIEASRS